MNGTKPLRLAANLSTLFQELPFERRAVEAAACGFSGLEMQFPYEHAFADWQRAIDNSGLPLMLLNAPRGSNGEPGLAALTDRRDEFAASIARAAEYAEALSCPLVHVLAGIGGDRACYLDNLAYAVDMLRSAGAQVVIEVLNQVDVPGYHLRSTADAGGVVTSVDGVGLQFDVYHCMRSGEDVATVVQGMNERPAHLQVSSCPGRNEPDDLAMSGVHSVIESGYDGFVGCEYWPASTTPAGLGWGRSFGLTGW